jgi:hypothetical protein
VQQLTGRYTKRCLFIYGKYFTQPNSSCRRIKKNLGALAWQFPNISVTAQAVIHQAQHYGIAHTHHHTLPVSYYAVLLSSCTWRTKWMVVTSRLQWRFQRLQRLCCRSGFQNCFQLYISRSVTGEQPLKHLNSLLLPPESRQGPFLRTLWYYYTVYLIQLYMSMSKFLTFMEIHSKRNWYFLVTFCHF